MRVFENKYPNKMFYQVLSTILVEGNKVTPRGLSTIELQPAVNVWEESEKMVLTIKGRKNNPFFTLIEALMIAAGRDDSEQLGFYNKQILRFLDNDSEKFNAFYGTRIRHWGLSKNNFKSFSTIHDQFKDCLNILKKDKDSRQAVICLWIPTFDCGDIITNDRPCNDLIMFKVREDKLNMTVCNRSNDFYLGLYSVNIMQFSLMQRILACLLGIKVGTYTHFSDSLHIYDENLADLSKILSIEVEDRFDVYEFVEPYNLSKEFSSIEDFDSQCKLFFDIETDIRNGFLSDGAFSNLVEIKSEFLMGVLKICYAYVSHKNKDNQNTLKNLFSAFELGLKDHTISCLEFVARKYQKDRSEDEMNKIFSFLDSKFKKEDSEKIKKFIIK